MRKITKRSAATAIAAAIALGGASTAWAVWTFGGTSETTATSGDVQTISLTGTANGLYPGASIPVSLSAINPNPFSVTINEVVGTPTITKVVSTEDCNEEEIGYILPTTPVTIGTGTTTPSAPDFKVTMDLDAGDECKNAQFKITVNYKGVQNS